MGIYHRGPTASKPKEPALHAFLHLHTIAYSPPQSSRWPCQRRPKATYTQMTHSQAWLFEVGYGHLPPWQEVIRDEIPMKLETGTVFSTFFILDSEGTISLKLKENDKSEHQIENFSRCAH